ncbi:MAG: helix-turn-helix domain-containing protein [archaeon]|nr:hypothetical protein [Nanoarchaeota archaeon]
MIVEKDFLNKLKDFGLNSYESKLWVALLSRGISTAGELSDISNVPRSRAYDVLESLEKKGFIVVKLGKPIKYLAVHPREVVERVKKKVSEEAAQKDKVLNKLKESEILTELDTLHTAGIKLVDPTDKSASFRGRDKVYEHLSFLIKNAKKSIHLMTTKEGLERKKDVLLNQMKKAAQRGVTIKISAPATTSKKVLDSFAQFAKVKTTKDLARFCVIDNKGLVLLLTDDQKTHPNYDSAIWVEAPHFVSYFTTLFEREWKN